MTEAKQGDVVKVDYEGKLQDGTVFDSSQGREPIRFTIGEGNVIAGFEQAVIGMSPGEKKTVTIPPADAYGDHQSELLLQVDRAAIPADAKISVGQILTMGNDQGATMNVTVVELTDDNITLDANHPLAGMTLEFTLELVEIAA